MVERSAARSCGSSELYPRGPAAAYNWLPRRAPPGEAGEVCSQRFEPSSNLSDKAEVKSNFITFQEPVGVTMNLRNNAGSVMPVGETTRYIIAVVNQGRSPVSRVHLIATVPQEFQILGTKTDCSGGEQEVIFDIFDVAVGGTTNYEVEVKAIRPGEAHFEVDIEHFPSRMPIHHDRSTTIYQP